MKMTRTEFYEASLDKQVKYLNELEYSIIDIADGSFVTFVETEEGYEIYIDTINDSEKGKLVSITSYNGRMNIEYENEDEENIILLPRFIKLVKEDDIFNQEENYSIDLLYVKDELLRRWSDYEDQTSGQWYSETIDGVTYNFKADMVDGSPSIITLRVVE